ncbi:MAG: HNH endonuclease signature motif containing protein [Acidobacteriota bacterium]
MSLSRVGARLRRFVTSRAKGLCEYCLIHEDDTFYGCQIDHIISEKHGGPTTQENLAYACIFCNRFKGSDLGSVVPNTGELVRFFNPRTDSWSKHFVLLSNMRIEPRTDIGTSTERILGFNENRRLIERLVLHQNGRYPTPQAQDLISG